MSTAIIPVIIPDAVLDFLDTCSNEQIAELFTRMRQMTSRESITGSFVVDKKRNKGKKINRVPKVAGESVQDATNVSGAKRSLNSFMAFRKYYIPIFPWLQQKEMSGFITILWREDPFHAKWTIVARAYSIIRDRVGKVCLAIH